MIKGIMPKSNLTGMYVTKTPDGKILTVQVKDIANNSYSMSPGKYRRQGIAPPIETLPVVVQGCN